LQTDPFPAPPVPHGHAWSPASFLPSFLHRRRSICFAASLRGFLPSIHEITIVVTLTVALL
jgi:hypothetical protein